jgi:hypothetical protein
MDSRNGNAAAAAAAPPLPQHPHALLALPDLDRPPAIMQMWELEAVTAALPAKKRRLRETFNRLAALAPAPLPFRWEDLDTYISSLQYSATLRHRQLRESGGSRAAPAIAPAPAAVSTGGDVVRQVRALEESRPVHIPVPVPILPAVSEPDAHRFRPLEESKPAHGAPAPAPAPATISAPTATGVDVEKSKKRKADAVHAAIRLQEVQAEMPKIHEDAAAASILQNKKKKSRQVPPGPADDDGHAAAEPNASADGTAQVDPVPVSKIAVAPQELPGPAAAARPASKATDRARPAGRLPLQRSRPLLHIPGFPVSTAVSAAPVTGSKKTQMQDDLVATKNTPHDDGEAKGSPCRPGGGGSGTGYGLLNTAAVTTQANVEPIGNIAGVRHESPAATGDGVRPTRVPEKSRPGHSPVRVPHVVSEPTATGDDAHKFRALEEFEPVHAPAPAPAAVSAPATTGVHVEKDKKRKASGQDVEAVNVAMRVDMRKLHEDAAAKEAASPLQGLNCNGKNSSSVSPGPADDNGVAAAEPNASADATAQVELPGPAAVARPASNATNCLRPTGRLPPQRSRPLLHIPAGFPASAAVSAALVTDSQKTQLQDNLVVTKNTAHDDGAGNGNGLLNTAAVTSLEPISKIAGGSPPKVGSFSLAKVPKQEPQDMEEVPDVEMEIVETVKQEHPNDEVPDVEMEIVEGEEMQALMKYDVPVADEEASSPLLAKAQEADKVSPLLLACSDGGLAQAAAGTTESSPAVTRDVPNVLQAGAPKSAGGVRTATRDDASDATRLAPAAAPQDAAAEVRSVPPRRGNDLAQSGVSIYDAMQTVVACNGAVATGRDVYDATDLVPSRGRKATGPSPAMAPPKFSNNKHVLRKQHMPKLQDGHTADNQPVPEAQAGAAQWSEHGEGRGGPGQGGFAAARDLQQGDGSRNKKGNAKGKPFKFCNKCGCKGHLSETCRTAKHLVDLYQRAKENQICYRCGSKGHWSRKCRTPKHLVDLYQKDRAAKRAAQGRGSP